MEFPVLRLVQNSHQEGLGSLLQTINIVKYKKEYHITMKGTSNLYVLSHKLTPNSTWHTTAYVFNARKGNLVARITTL